MLDEGAYNEDGSEGGEDYIDEESVDSGVLDSAALDDSEQAERRAEQREAVAREEEAARAAREAGSSRQGGGRFSGEFGGDMLQPNAHSRYASEEEEGGGRWAVGWPGGPLHGPRGRPRRWRATQARAAEFRYTLATLKLAAAFLLGLLVAVVAIGCMRARQSRRQPPGVLPTAYRVRPTGV